MEQTDKKRAAILEKDSTLAKATQKILEERGFTVCTLSDKQEAIKEIRTYALAIVGDAEGSSSVFETMREIVMNSPMTSIILITDLPEKEVEDTAEGYGILGQVRRNAQASQLDSLIDQYESIMNPAARS